MSEIKITPCYSSINAVKDICEPWIEIWGGSEWGESMRALHTACHTSYGFSDEDCALLVGVLWSNLESMKEWMDTEGQDHDLSTPEQEKWAVDQAREKRDYWRKGGNLTNWPPAISPANETIDSLPGWLFGDE